MRLIDASSLRGGGPPTFLEVFDPSTVEYAILSHRWDVDEFTYQDATVPSQVFWDYRLFNKRGYKKVFEMARTALMYSVRYIWVDTCCIDKTNFAELTESINSMFRWYAFSRYCFAYLADWTVELKDFTQSVWFTRCWTLQELIAPSKVIFLDSEWETRGNKLDLAEQISQRTRIDPAVLTGQHSKDRFSICFLLSTEPIARLFSLHCGKRPRE